jgi:polyferredoxin
VSKKDKTTIKRLLLLVKTSSLLILGPIIIFGHYNFSIVGGLFGCPFSIPFILCPACPTPCTFNLIRPWFFSVVLAGGMTIGRVFCGILCPLGLASELAYKIPVRKRHLPSFSWLPYLKYGAVVLLLYIMLEAAATLLGLNVEGLWFMMITYQKGVTTAIIVVSLSFLIFSVTLYKPFCRHLCPFGTIMSVSNRFGFWTLKRHSESCEECNSCIKNCPMSLQHSYDSKDCFRCLSCLATCENDALRLDVRRTNEK